MFMNLLAAGGDAGKIENPLHFDWAYISGNLPKAFIATAIGIVMVFLILAILIGFITLLRVILSRKSGKSVPAAPVVPVMPAADADEENARVAAITAAVSVMLAEENGGEPVEFVIKKIKRTR